MSERYINLRPEPFDPIEVWLFRIVLVEVLPELFRKGMLCPPSTNDLKAYEQMQIAKPNMLVKRKHIKTPSGFSLHDHIAFYFAPRSPMLYSFNMNNDENTSYPYRRIVYLITKLKLLLELPGAEFYFTDVNATDKTVRFSNNLNELSAFLDFRTLEAEFFNRTENDPRPRSRRQAEFLYRGCIPVSCFQHIRCHDETIEAEIKAMNLPIGVKVDHKKKLYF